MLEALNIRVSPSETVRFPGVYRPRARRSGGRRATRSTSLIAFALDAAAVRALHRLRGQHGARDRVRTEHRAPLETQRVCAQIDAREVVARDARRDVDRLRDRVVDEGLQRR